MPSLRRKHLFSSLKLSSPTEKVTGTAEPSSTQSSPTSSRNSSPVSPIDSSISTPATSFSSLENHSSCNIDPDDFFARFRGDIDISDSLPTASTLVEAGEIPIFDADGKGRPFKSLYSGDTAIGERQLILFVRHFYCGACQSYLKALTDSIDRATYFSMPTPTSITIIGCGSPRMIPYYRSTTGTPFTIYADPSRALYKALHMSWSLNIGPSRPDYMKDISPPAWLAGQVKQIARNEAALKFRGGNWLQIGGEFLFQDGEVRWCHRMRNYRDHTEVRVLRRVLEIDED
ncbi:hypothetical protein LTR28_007771 [Elasticomyces elasticus]|nr:hypothetical protein LTR28_007771 [Elasticomyces elasticus]